MDYSEEIKNTVKQMVIRKAKVSDIERETKVKRRTIYAWIKKHNWDALAKTDEVLETIEQRIIGLINKPDLTEKDLNLVERLQGIKAKEIKLKSQGHEGLILAAAHKVQQEAPLKPENIAANKKKARSGKRSKNDLTGISPEEVEKKFLEGLFGYQIQAWKTRHKRVRFTLKSRQIGWTFYSAREAFAKALMSGTNQAFLSASKAQSALFKNYIVSFAMEWFQVELSGSDKITIRTDHGDATLYFLSTNSSTAQGPSGDVYIDECFWIRDFVKLKDLAGAIATQDGYTKTYFSTPSTKSHGAAQLWFGDEYKKNQEKRPTLEAFKMPTAKQLRKGHDCVDGIFRQVITIHDAMAGGATFFNIKNLEMENTPDIFAQLYECKFIDDTNSAFVLDELLRCSAKDTRWPDYKPKDSRPFINKPVWIGYDPAKKRDSAAIVVLAPPTKPGGKFRVLEKIIMHKQNWAHQAEVIKALTKKYNVEYIGIDSTGPGNGVYERVKEFFPAATEINYTQEMKTKLVLKAQEIIGQNRLEYNEKHTDIAIAFLAIRRTNTGSSITFVAARDLGIGHADVAWAIMHALIKEGLKITGTNKSTYILG
jgi:uncharacterized protein YjcR